MILFAQNGAKVAVTAKKIMDEDGIALPIGGDVTSLDDVKRIIAETAKKLRRPTVLINNAGVDLEGRKDIIDVTEEAFDRTMAVNVKGPWLMMKYVDDRYRSIH